MTLSHLQRSDSDLTWHFPANSSFRTWDLYERSCSAVHIHRWVILDDQMNTSDSVLLKRSSMYTHTWRTVQVPTRSPRVPPSTDKIMAIIGSCSCTMQWGKCTKTWQRREISTTTHKAVTYEDSAERHAFNLNHNLLWWKYIPIYGNNLF